MKAKLLLGLLVLGIAFVQSQAQTLNQFQIGTKATANPPSGTNINVWPSNGNENPANVIDGVLTNKYLNFGEQNTGYIFTLSTGTVVVDGLSLTTANDSEVRDPATFSLWGSNSVVADATPGKTYDLSSFTPIVLNLALTLPSARNTTAPLITFSNTTAYSTYLLVFPTVKDAVGANSMQIAEARLTSGGAAGTPISNSGTVAGGQLIPEPSSLLLLTASVGALALRRRR